MAKAFTVTFSDGNDWKLPFNFALGMHVILILGCIYMPDIMKRKPLYPEIYTIDLVNVQIPEIVEPDLQPIQHQPKNEQAVSVAPKPEPVAQEVKPISIKPLKKKKINKNAKEQARKKELEQIRNKQLAEAREAERRAKEAERLAEEEANLAADQAVNQLRNMLRETTISTTRKPQKKSSQTSGKSGGKKTNIIEKQYFASVYNVLQSHWKLPEYKVWDPQLVATIVIKITQNGSIVDHYFEKKSGDRLFDQFVVKTIQDSNPLPSIPPALKKKVLEIGLHFKPGSIQY